MKLTKGNATRILKETGMPLHQRELRRKRWTAGFQSEALGNGSVIVEYRHATWDLWQSVPEDLVRKCAVAIAPHFPCVTLIRIAGTLSIVIHQPENPPRPECIIETINGGSPE